MKKVLLIVPDRIEHVIGSSRSRRCRSEDVTAERIKKALCDRGDYRQYYYFQSAESVKVVSILDHEG